MLGQDAFKGFQQTKKELAREDAVVLELTIDNKAIALKIAKVKRQLDDFIQ